MVIILRFLSGWAVEQCKMDEKIPALQSRFGLFQYSNFQYSRSPTFHFLFPSIALTALAISRLRSPTASLRAATEPAVDFSWALRITRDSLTTATFLSAPSRTDQRANNWPLCSLLASKRSTSISTWYRGRLAGDHG